MPARSEQVDELCRAAAEGDTKTVARLLAAGVPINARGKGGYTALIRAAEKGQSAMVRLLLERGANPDGRHPVWGTALHHAIAAATSISPEGDAMGTIRALVDAGADVNLADRDGRTPLMRPFSLYEPGTQILDLLLDAGADLHLRAKDSSDALYWAVVFRNEAAVKRLLKSGAEVNRIYEKGQTLVDWLDHEGNGKPHRAKASLYRLIRKSGGKYARGFKDGRDARVRQKELERVAGEKEQRKLRADQKVIPDLAKAAATDWFKSAIAKLERVCGTSRSQIPFASGVACCEVDAAKSRQLLKKHRAWFLAAGCYLFRGESLWMKPGEPELLAILPTTDQLQVVAAMAPGCGDNHGIGIAKVLHGLRKLHALTPFVLDRVAHDRIEGRFTRKHKKPDEVAKVIYRICPDAVTQGTETIEALAALLKKTDHLRLWWD